MSTRSGKRLHHSSNENDEPELALKSSRKTRSKPTVENGDNQSVIVKGKKRQNYVSFPAEEDNMDVDSVEDEPAKPARALRRYTLKEQNAPTDEVNTVSTVAMKKQARSTRRTKKFSETEEAPDVPVVEEALVPKAKGKGKKNKKKSRIAEPEVVDKENVKVGKKKKNKKKISQSSLVEEEKCNGKRKNESNVSTDSFHSAAGSPPPIDTAPALDNNSPTHTEALSLRKSNKNKKRTSSLKRACEPISTESMNGDEDSKVEIETETSVRTSKHRRSSLKPTMPEKVIPETVDKLNLNTTFENEPAKEGSGKKKRKSSMVVENMEPLLNTTTNLDISKTPKVINTTFEKDDIENDVKSIKSKTNKNFDKKKQDTVIDTVTNLNSSFENRRSPRQSVNGSEKSTMNGTFDMSPKPDLTKQKSLDSSYEKESKLDSTFDKTDKVNLDSKSSLISSDATNNSIISLDKSDNSKITEDDSKTENILNTTPLLIESSMEESRVLESSLKENKTPESQPIPVVTPLQREGTFTKDSPSLSPKHTPNKRQTLPAAGCTPYHSNGKGSSKRSVLNLTHSIEKPGRRSSAAEAPRATRVMFCSPVNNPGIATQRKIKIIKSNLKGSKKSFVYDDTESLQPPRAGRKRSFTHTEGSQSQAGAEAGAGAGGGKRARLQAERLPPARARTNSAMAKLSNAATPTKPATPKSEVKATKLPNFAALHARRFQRMESLDECQLRKAKRAQQLLVPTGSVAVLERSSPRVTLEPKPRETAPTLGSPAPPAPALPTLASLQRGYTRFGFKMQCDVNPFSVPPKTADKTNKPNGVKPDQKPNGVKLGVKPSGLKLNSAKPIVSLKREVSQPSLAGATSLRRAVAKQTIMREKSFTLAEKRNETRKEVRTVIKGVRTNRRFELQMKSRNLNG